MSERNRRVEKKAEIVDPVTKAVDLFNEQAFFYKRYDPDALRKALDRVKNIGTSHGESHFKSPGELYAFLATLSDEAGVVAEAEGDDENRAKFEQQRDLYQNTSQALGGDPTDITNPSQPLRTSGVAAG